MDDEARSVFHVLIVHYNTPDLTSRLVRRFPQVTPSGREVRVHILDNASSPENIQRLTGLLHEVGHVSLKFNDTNVGFGEGINTLAGNLDSGGDDIFWILNPDTQLIGNCIEALELELAAFRFDIVSPLICSGEGDDLWIWYCGGSIDYRSLRIQHQFYSLPVNEAPCQSFATEFLTGAAPMMLASTFHKVGGFPTDYFLYWEDTYFSWKARALGLSLGVVPAASIWHAGGASSGRGLSQTFYYWFSRNRFIFASDLGIALSSLIFGVGILETVRPVARALRDDSERFAKACASIRGTVAGILAARGSRAAKSNGTGL